jgi:hypothetical protein
MLEQVQKLYPKVKAVYGPYTRKQDGRAIVILYDGDKRTAKLLAKIRLEIKLNRCLSRDETVDHKDDDITNDTEDNLQLLSRVENAKKSAKRNGPVQAKCRWCEKVFTLTKHQYAKRLVLKEGPFCSRQCSGRYGTFIQHCV